MNAVEIKDLRKFYGKHEALKGITLDVPQGTIYGLLGPNGAGKSTTIKALVGALQPTSGSVKVVGFDPLKHKARVSKKIGYMPQSPALYPDLSARENIRFFGRLHDVAQLEQKVEDILDFTELLDRAQDPVYTFSGGMKKRVSLACALIHRPKILFLDEPTAAVDPHLKVRLWQLFRQLAKQGVTIFVSTHLMDEALLCDQLAIMRKGLLIAVDTPKNIMQRGKVTLTMQVAGKKVKNIIGGNPKELAQALYEYKLSSDVTSIQVEQETLEEIVLDIIKKDQA